MAGNVVESTLINPMEILYRGHADSKYVLASSAKTTAVTPNGGLDGTNGNLPTNRPLGALSGMVAATTTVSGYDYGVRICSKALEPVGLFVANYTGWNFENSPGVASDKLAVVNGQAKVKVYIFETRNEADSADLSYTLGNKLYSSDNGLLTNQTATTGTVVGMLTHVPTASNDWLGVDMRI